MIERVAKAIYDANDKLSGDSIGTVIVASDHLFPQRSHMEGNSSSKAYQLAAMDICRSAARAAIEAMMEPTPDAWLIPDAYAVIGDADRAASFVADGHDVVPLYALRTSLTGDSK